MKELKIIELVSERASRLWNGWEIRVVVQLSLIIQVILILFGSQRKHRRGILIKVVVWSSYMAADWVATVGLGNLAKVQTEAKHTSEKNKYVLQAFWAPFLLLHLGGPDTITAYAIEDNELWLRHLLAIIVETGVAIYVIVRSWTYTTVSVMSLPVLVIGSIKYGERTYVLWSASTNRFKDKLLATNPFEDNATKVIIEIKDESFHERKVMMGDAGEEGTKQQSPHYLVEADSLYKRFRYLFANLILGLNERIYCYNIIHQKSAQDAFKLVEVELGFLYDVLYTKASFIYSKLGFCFRCFIFLCSVTGLVVFAIMVHVHQYNDPTDISVCFILLGGAVLLEVVAFVRLLLSDWTRLWFVKQGRLERHSLSIKRKRRWSHSMAQYNLIDFCFKDVKGMPLHVHKLPCFQKYLEEYRNMTWKHVTEDVLEAIYNQLREKGRGIKDTYTIRSCKEILAQRGHSVLKKYGIDNQHVCWYTVDIEFDHSLLVWHMATDILYYVDFDQKQTDENILRKRKISKYLSNYMLYILVVCPAMLPQGIGEIKYRDTCDQVKKFYKDEFLNENTEDYKNSKIFAKIMACKKALCKLLFEKKKMTYKKDLCKLLFDENKEIPLMEQSVLSEGCKLAHELQLLEWDKNWNRYRKWEMISEFWIEMMSYAAIHCGWKEHSQQLWKGGELLTHVSVLMTHFGLSAQYTEREQFVFI